MYNNHSNNTGNGFTLIEIIASIAILGIVIAVFLPIFPQVMSWSNKTEQELVSGNLIEQAIYDVKQDDSFIANLNEKVIPNCTSSYQIEADLPKYTINGVSHSVIVNVCQSEKEMELGLYRTKVQISSPNGVSSESYTYLHGVINE